MDETGFQMGITSRRKVACEMETRQSHAEVLPYSLEIWIGDCNCSHKSSWMGSFSTDYLC